MYINQYRIGLLNLNTKFLPNKILKINIFEMGIKNLMNKKKGGDFLFILRAKHISFSDFNFLVFYLLIIYLQMLLLFIFNMI